MILLCLFMCFLCDVIKQWSVNRPGEQRIYRQNSHTDVSISMCRYLHEYTYLSTLDKNMLTHMSSYFSPQVKCVMYVDTLRCWHVCRHIQMSTCVGISVSTIFNTRWFPIWHTPTWRKSFELYTLLNKYCIQVTWRRTPTLRTQVHINHCMKFAEIDF